MKKKPTMNDNETSDARIPFTRFLCTAAFLLGEGDCRNRPGLPLPPLPTGVEVILGSLAEVTGELRN